MSILSELKKLTAKQNAKVVSEALPDSFGSGGGALYVTFSYDSENNSYSADKTYAEILAALDAGQAVFGKFTDEANGLTNFLNCVESLRGSDGGDYIEFEKIRLFPANPRPVPTNARISQQTLIITEDNTVIFESDSAEFSA